MPDERPDLTTLIHEQLDRAESDDGDTGDEPTAPEPAARDERRAAGNAPAEPESGPDAGDDDWFSLPEEPAEPPEELFRWDELPDDPAIQKLAKGLQGTATRKYQELAEERKRIEAERAELARYREYEELRRQSPQAAAQLLQQELEQLSGAGPSAQRPALGADPVGQQLAALAQAELTPEESAIAQALQAVYQQNLSLQQVQAQERQRQEQERVERVIQQDMSEVEGLVKRKLTDAEWNKIAGYANERGIRRLSDAFRLMYQDHFLKAAETKGVKRAEQTLSRKSLQSAMPPGAPPRTGSEPRPPKDLRGNVMASLDEFGIT